MSVDIIMIEGALLVETNPIRLSLMKCLPLHEIHYVYPTVRLSFPPSFSFR